MQLVINDEIVMVDRVLVGGMVYIRLSLYMIVLMVNAMYLLHLAYTIVAQFHHRMDLVVEHNEVDHYPLSPRH